MRRSMAAVAGFVSLLAASAPSSGAPDTISLTPHRAVYDLALAKGGGSRNMEGARGRIAFEFTGDACEGYALNYRQVTVLDSSEIGMALEAPRTVVQGGEIRGAVRGVGIRAATSVSGVRIADVDEGVVVAETGIADLGLLDVTARLQAVRVQPGGLVDPSGPSLALLPLDEAPSDGSAWLPFVGVAAILTALFLELLRWTRERHDALAPAPLQVGNQP